MVKVQKTPQSSKARLAVKKYGATTETRKYARTMSENNPGWRQGGSNSVARDVRTHKSLYDNLGDHWAGSSISSIRRLRESNGKSCGGTISRKKSK